MEHLRHFLLGTGAAIAAYWANIPALIQILLCACALDIVTGLIAAGYKKELDSKVGQRGITRKVVVILLVGAAEYIGIKSDLTLALPWGGVAGLGSALAGYYLINEVLSIAENAARCNASLPKPLVDALRQLQRKSSQPNSFSPKPSA